MLANGAWTKEDQKFHQHSDFLARFMVDAFPKNLPVIDFGCGTGHYVRHLRYFGYNAHGYDGYVGDSFPFIKWADLTQPLTVTGEDGNILSGSVISLEVGEHIPPEYQEVFTETVTKHCSAFLLFSWAEIGQPGIGHVNCRDQEEVIEDICDRGFIYRDDVTAELRKGIESNCDWFRRTLLLFERQ